MDIKDSKFDEVLLKLKDYSIVCEKIGTIWVPNEMVLLKKEIKLLIKQKNISYDVNIKLESN